MFIAFCLVLLSRTVFGEVRLADIPAGGTKNVLIGDHPVFRCNSPQGDALNWIFISTSGESIINNTAPYTVTNTTSMGFTSILTINAVQEPHSGDYICQSKQDSTDSVAFSLVVTSAGSVPTNWISPHIERRVEGQTHLEVEVDRRLTLKCIGGSEGSVLIFEHNGIGITQDDRNTLTVSGQLNSQAQIIILTRDPADSGTYTCRDTSHSGSPSDQIDVVVKEKPSVHLQIMEPSGSITTVMAGENFNIKCQARMGTSIEWYLNDVKLTSETNGFIIDMNEDQATQTTGSVLTKEVATVQDGGEYLCLNSERKEERATVTVEVRTPEYQAAGDGIPNESRHVVMKVGSTVNLECSLEAPGEYRPEWSKDGQIICSGPKYSITMDTKPSSLVVKNADRGDSGIYTCVFKHRDSGHVGAVIVFNVSALLCPDINAPQFGSFDMCPRFPLHGDSCTFKCQPEFKLTNSKPLVCEQENGETYWQGTIPRCKRIPADELQAGMPTSWSHVLLQIGWNLELRCSHLATWNKDGVQIHRGQKYHIRNGNLVIRNPDKLDAGIYDCFVRDSTDLHLKGIKKFNVSTLACPRLHPPKNGSIVQCSSRPVYGEKCIFRCNKGLKLTGSRTRACVLTSLSHSNTQVYWTGGDPSCTGAYSANFQYTDSASLVSLSYFLYILIVLSYLH